MFLKDQHEISAQRGMPSNDKGGSSTTQSITGETVQLYYWNNGVLTSDAGQAAGTVVEGRLTYTNVLNAAGSMQGTNYDTSLSFTSTALTSEVAISSYVAEQYDALAGTTRASSITSGFTNGQYAVDYERGVIYGVKASTATTLTSTAYKIKQKISGATTGVPSAVQGNVASSATDSGNPVKVGGVYNSTLPTLTNGQRGDIQLDSRAGVIVAGTVASGATDIGGPVKVGGKYNSSAPTLTDGQRGDLQLDASANMKITQATTIAGEDITNDVIKTEQRFSFINISADTLVKTGTGFVHTVTFAQIDAAPTAGTIIIYDNTAESGTVIFSSTWTTAVFYPTTITLDCTFSTGLYVGFTTTADIGVTVSYR